MTPPLPALVPGSPRSLLVRKEGGLGSGPGLAPCPGTAQYERGRFGDGQRLFLRKAGGKLEHPLGRNRSGKELSRGADSLKGTL